MNQDQLEVLLNQIGYDLQELKKQLAITNKRLEEHIRQFDAHKKPITQPRWMQQDPVFFPRWMQQDPVFF